jgi:hypothetical protein
MLFLEALCRAVLVGLALYEGKVPYDVHAISERFDWRSLLPSPQITLPRLVEFCTAGLWKYVLNLELFVASTMRQWVSGAAAQLALDAPKKRGDLDATLTHVVAYRLRYLMAGTNA